MTVERKYEIKKTKGERTMKKTISIILTLVICVSALVGCGSNGGETTDTTEVPDEAALGEITVITREEGSGTRGAFIELFGVEVKDASGKKVDMTYEDAVIADSTSVMMTSVAGNKTSIGYISLGSLNDTVKAVEIDGVAATVDNIKSGTYKIARPFNIATKENISEAAKAFISFIMSSEGQAVIEGKGYISAEAGAPFAGSTVEGKVVVAGSSSVTPVMEKLKEAYLKVNPKAEIEIQQSDSSTGMNSTIDGICDIGMASRQLKDSETQAGLKATVIAMDGIAVIVNNENSIAGLTSDQVKAIFTGELTSWDKI